MTMQDTTAMTPKARQKNPRPQVVSEFEEACASEQRCPGLVVEALMSAYIQMKPKDRLDLCVVRAKHLKKIARDTAQS